MTRRAAALACALALASCSDGGAGRAAFPFRFTDATAAAGIDLWLVSGETPSTQILEVKGGGLALLDVEGDGDLDVFAPNGATLRSPQQGPGARLLRNELDRGALRFADATAALGVDFRRWGMGAAVGDVDGDGYDDVFVSCFGPDALLANGRGARLAEEQRGVGGSGWSTGCAFGDLDRDGDLDLYVAGYLVFDPAAPPAPTSFLGVEVFAGPVGLVPEPDRALANRGDGTFEDVTAAAGFDAVEPAFGLGVAILDLDGDGLQDVLVGNDSMPSFLFLGRPSGRFEEAGLRSGIALSGDGQAQATMGIAIADVNGDGAPDVFTTNFASDTNTLHVSRAGGGFDDRTRAYGLAAVSKPFLGWATTFCDFDHDGDEDLVVFNGHVYPERVTDRLGVARAQAPLLFERRGPRFERVPAAVGGEWLAEPHVDRSAVFGDLDRDGDVDALVSELGGRVRLLRNDGAAGAWLVVALHDGRAASRNPRGLGSRVELDAGGARQVRWIHGGGSYLASSAPEAHFGVPSGALVSLVVTWPDGARTELAGVAPRQRVVVER